MSKKGGLPLGLIFAGLAVAAVVILVVYFSTRQAEKDDQAEEDDRAPRATAPVVRDSAPVSNPVGTVRTVADAQNIDNQSWRDKNPGASIKNLGACGEAKTYDSNKVYEGASKDNYANYCFNFIKSVECADQTCSVPQVFGACRDECTGRMNSGQRMSQIGAGAGRITYPEYKAWRDKSAYPGSGKRTWAEHCAWKGTQQSLANNMVTC